jgi:hypothetical protein
MNWYRLGSLISSIRLDQYIMQPIGLRIPKRPFLTLPRPAESYMKLQVRYSQVRSLKIGTTTSSTNSHGSKTLSLLRLRLFVCFCILSPEMCKRSSEGSQQLFTEIRMRGLPLHEEVGAFRLLLLLPLPHKVYI